ncbi:hypothetical protein FNF29_00842 [Cafeteria roenbergensis]|uniref:Uncharacterized protein n=1 Tax=Cafeteria roenbergensis TaxID=33653 RepID=A0A5A8CYA2_CAFRO|nr:hypothetical protein FNF29_00842 [Cafeteria roenbergensis]KAA0165141.1 hypothetical protein FNF28_03540 [Cafeteria roenbergensis]|eukprot:KAA0156731.1 hypothetical protein FNF29_00842 [Cafeteria roenbergensis]
MMHLTALHVAAANGAFRSLAAILASTFDSALMPCVGSRQWLKRRRKCHKLQDERGWTPLHWATYKGFHCCASLLIHYGFRVDAADLSGVCPAERSLSASSMQASVGFCVALAASLGGIKPRGRRVPLVSRPPASREAMEAALSVDAPAAARAVVEASASAALDYLGLPGVAVPAPHVYT